MGDLSSKELICEGEIIDPSTNSQITVITPKSEDIQDQLREHSQPVNDPLLHLACATEVIDPASLPNEMLQTDGSEVQSSDWEEFDEFDNHSHENGVADTTFETANSQLTEASSSSQSPSSSRDRNSSHAENQSPDESHETVTEELELASEVKESEEWSQEEASNNSDQNLSISPEVSRDVESLETGNNEELEKNQAEETKEENSLSDEVVEGKPEHEEKLVGEEIVDSSNVDSTSGEFQQPENREGKEPEQPESPKEVETGTTDHQEGPQSTSEATNCADEAGELSDEENGQDRNLHQVPILLEEDETYPAFIRLLEVIEEEYSGSETCSEVFPYLVEEFEEDVKTVTRPGLFVEELTSTSPTHDHGCHRFIVQEFSDSEETTERRRWSPTSDDWLDDFWIMQGCSTADSLEAFEELEAELCRLVREQCTPVPTATEVPNRSILRQLPPEFRLKVLEKFLTLPVIHGVVGLTEGIYSGAKNWSPTPIRMCWNLSEKAVSVAINSLAWLSRPIHKPIHRLDDLVCKLMNIVDNRSYEL